MAKKKAKSKAAEKPAKSGDPDQELQIADFEEAVKEIEAIVDRLESGDADLGEAIADYEQGIARLKQCHRLLDVAQQRVMLLSQSEDEGGLHLEPMPETEFRTGGGQSQATKGDDDSGPGGSRMDDSAGLF